MTSSSTRPSLFILSRSIAALLVAGSASSALAQSFWNGNTSPDWNNPLNWSAGVPGAGVDAVVNLFGDITAPFTATISANIPTPRDILVGDGAGTNGRVNQTGGTATTGANNWAVAGRNGGTGTYNLSGGLLDTNPISTNQGQVRSGEANSTGTINVTGSGSINTYRIYVGTGGGSNGTLNINTTGTLTLSNDLFVGENATNATGAVTMTAGTLNRTGGWTVIGGSGAGGTGSFTMTGGTVTAAGDSIVGLAANSNGTLTQSGGSFTTGALLQIGRGGGTGNATFSNSAALNVGSTMQVGVNGGSNGTATIGGSALVNVGALFQVGAGGGTGTATVNSAGAALNVAGEIHAGNDAGSIGNFTVSAGTVSSGSWIGVGRNGSTGTLTVSGTGVVQQTGPVIGQNNAGTLELTNFGVGGTAVVNLDGGSLIVNRVDKQGGVNGSATFNFNGGRLTARANDVDFMEGLNTASVKAGGAIIDSQAFNITISQNLLAGSVGGGLTKLGSGALTLEGTNTYTGGSTVTGGSLLLATAGATMGTGNVSVLNTAITLSITSGVTNAIGDAATLSLAGGGTPATADLGFVTLGSGVSETVFGLKLNNVSQLVGSYGSTASLATFKNDEFFSGPGVLNVVPEPSVALSLVSGLGVLLAVRRRRTSPAGL